jgi:trimethylamine--corrinoid protein Co-methyltransferase
MRAGRGRSIVVSLLLESDDMASAETGNPPPTARRARGGADVRRAARGHPKLQQLPTITRRIPLTEVLNEEGLALIERNADTILEEIGIEFRDDEECLALWREAGADIKGTRVRFPRGLARSIVRKSAPRQFTQAARNPERSVDRRQPAVIRAGLWAPSSARSTRAGATPPSRTSATS